jgi:hypothetical protein
MPVSKLNIEATEVELYKKALELAEVKVLEVVTTNVITIVAIKFKSEQDLIKTGRFIERLLTSPAIPAKVDTKINTKAKTKLKQNGKAKN